MIRIGIIGGTGYTGMELMRLLVKHPQVEIVAVCSRSQAGKDISTVFPQLEGKIDLKFESSLKTKCDIVFFASPNGVAMQQVSELLAQGTKIIDLSADFRLKDAGTWEHWYEMPHHCPNLLDQAVYGLPEVYRRTIKDASLIANPGCYPTAVILGFYPLLKDSIRPDSVLIADVKSGVSGAGKRADERMLLPELVSNLKAYKASAHRHFPEIQQQLQAIGEMNFQLSFTPHLIPISRGIIATLYCEVDATKDELQDMFLHAYKEEPFVRILPIEGHPETRYVAGTNACHIAIHKPDNSQVAKIIVAIDNLIKGAAGQAVQNMNLMFGFEETTGLESIAVLP